MKDWLPRGAIDRNDERLEVDLTGPGWHLNKSDQIVLESKQDMQKRGVSSPDDGDALALTFAQQVAPVQERRDMRYPARRGPGGWMG
jgi:hypothetical protein